MSRDLKKLKRLSIKDRKSKVNVSHLSYPAKKDDTVVDFIKGLPDLHQVRELKELAVELLRIKGTSGKILWMLGGHVVKCGISPLIIDFMKDGLVDYVAMNGGASIHDFELSIFGETSEDVKEGLEFGMFGVARETGSLINNAISEMGGIGESLGEKIENESGRFKDVSILWNAYRLNIPITVHTAIGADIIHQHPEMDGRAFGQASFNDFKKMIEFLPSIENGAILNLGSAVILPEVFLKALNASRNLTGLPKEFTKANFDMLPTYREIKNILERTGKGRKYVITGRHEIVIPLFSAILKSIG